MFFKQLQVNRPNATVVNAAICTERGHVSISVPKGYGGPGAKIGAAAGASQSAFQVTCLPMRDITRALRIQHVDLLSVDVEGAELKVLRSFDWDAISVNVILIEVDKLSEIDKRKLATLLTSKGFSKDASWAQFGDANAVWVHSSFRARAASGLTARGSGAIIIEPAGAIKTLPKGQKQPPLGLMGCPREILNPDPFATSLFNYTDPAHDRAGRCFTYPSRSA